MEIDWSKAFTFFLSMSAVVISIFTIFMTRRNLKKQLRLSKLEEILEILHYLNGYYGSMYRVFTGIEVIAKELQKNDIKSPVAIEISKYRKGFIETITKEMITNKISRLKVLSNAYLSNSKEINGSKIRIHTISNVFYNMYMYIYMQGDGSIIRKNDDAVIPNPDNLDKFISKIENDLIIEMNLGYKNIDMKSLLKYFQTQFKKDLEN